MRELKIETRGDESYREFYTTRETPAGSYRDLWATVYAPNAAMGRTAPEISVPSFSGSVAQAEDYVRVLEAALARARALEPIAHDADMHRSAAEDGEPNARVAGCYGCAREADSGLDRLDALAVSLNAYAPLFAQVEDTGGGLSAVVVSVGEPDPRPQVVVITESEETEGGWTVGIYATDEEWHGETSVDPEFFEIAPTDGSERVADALATRLVERGLLSAPVALEEVQS